MKRYIFDEKIAISYNASSKARDDVAYFVQTYKTADGNSYHVIGNNDKTKAENNFRKALIGIHALREAAFRLGKDDILFVQSSLKILSKINLMKKIIKFKTIYLVHDLDALRDRGSKKALKAMIRELNQQDVVICHNQAMKKELIKRGCRTELITLQLFDYRMDDMIKHRKYWKKQCKLCFAGNLSPRKTGFLYLLDKSTVRSYPMLIYGKSEKEFQSLEYKGCYPPDQLPQIIEGNMGLIWEGNQFVYEAEQCPYIMYNNPHKASLYIAAGLPIVIWKKAAMADFVEKEKIGVTISDLNELNQILPAISEEQYSEMLANVMRIRNEIISGNYLHRAIWEAEEKILNGKDIS